MGEEIKLVEPRTEGEKYFQPEWLDRAREAIRCDTEGMTAEEEAAYYNERGSWVDAARERDDDATKNMTPEERVRSGFRNLKE